MKLIAAVLFGFSFSLPLGGELNNLLSSPQGILSDVGTLDILNLSRRQLAGVAPGLISNDIPVQEMDTNQITSNGEPILSQISTDKSPVSTEKYTRSIKETGDSLLHAGSREVHSPGRSPMTSKRVPSGTGSPTDLTELIRQLPVFGLTNL